MREQLLLCDKRCGGGRRGNGVFGLEEGVGEAVSEEEETGGGGDGEDVGR